MHAPTRRRRESNRISDDAVVTVLAIRGTSVPIGAEAPKRTHVVRSELNNHDLAASEFMPGKNPSPSTETCDYLGLNTWESEGGAGNDPPTVILSAEKEQGEAETGIAPCREW
jgi:carbon storage regulator CsrA